MGTPEGGYCIQCGHPLSPEHRFCPACGTGRWIPPSTPEEDSRAAAAGALPLPGLPWVFAAGAVLWLLLLAETAGGLAATPTRRQILDQLARSGYSGQDAVVLALVEGAIMLLIPLAIAALHATAFYGLRGRHRWGWFAAVLVAGAWSLALVGIPILALLLRPATRSAYNVR